MSDEVRIPVYLLPALRDALDQLAKQHRQSRNKEIVCALEWYVAEMQKEMAQQAKSSHEGTQKMQHRVPGKE